MTHVDIQKAAEQYAFSQVPDARERYLLSKGFKDGAKWRIDSVWHNASELPTNETENILAIGINEEIIPIRICESLQKSWNEKVEYLHIMRWAYIKDLIPIHK